MHTDTLKYKLFYSKFLPLVCTQMEFWVALPGIFENFSNFKWQVFQNFLSVCRPHDNLSIWEIMTSLAQFAQTYVLCYKHKSHSATMAHYQIF